VQTEDSRGTPSDARLRTGLRGLLLVSGALLCLVAAPAEALAANSTAATPTPELTPAASPDPLVAQLTLTQTVDKATAAVGDTVSYTVTLGNTGSLPAAGVTVDDVLSGSAGYLVDDGTSGTSNTFVGEPVTTITRVLTGHYQWTYAAVNPGDADIVRFSAVITAPRGSLPAGVGAITLSSTASTTGIPVATVTTTAPFTSHSVPGGVRGARTGVPPTGSGLNAAIAGFLLLGGLGFILLAMHARSRDEFAD
jgi:uncharacterized repeat protein (TIGR01451 family)